MSFEEVLHKNHEWWMNYDINNTKKYDSINNPNGNITTARIMKDNSNWDIKDMQEVNRHLITIDSQDHSCSTKTKPLRKDYDPNNSTWWTNRENLVIGNNYTINYTQKPYIEFLCSPSTLEYLKMVCDTDDLVKCMLNNIYNERINLTKLIYNEPCTNIEVARLEPTNWRPYPEAGEFYSEGYNCTEDLACATMISRIGYGNEQGCKNKDFLKHIVEIVSKIPNSHTDQM